MRNHIQKQNFFHSALLLLGVLSLLSQATGIGQSSGKPKPVVSTGNFLSFRPVVTYNSGGSYPVSVAVADVNGDGKPDILVANQGSGGTMLGTVSVLLGNGDGTFQAATSYGTGGSFIYSLVVGDVNGDGKLDLVVANAGSNSNTVGVLLGHGDGTFATAVTYDSGGYFPESVAIADVNGNGVADIVVLDCGNRFAGCGGGQNGTAAVLLGNGDGTFRAGASYDAGSGAIWLAVADVNRDGKPDIVVADCGANIFCPTSAPGSLSVLLGNGDGTFQTAASYKSGGISTMSVAVADMNGDGKPDLLAANWGSRNTVTVLLGNGDGTFQPAVSYGAVSAPMSIAVADVDGDGKLDLLVANYGDDTVGVLPGTGDGTFQSAFSYDSGGHGATSIAVKDINGDGKPDVIVANFYANTVGVLVNNTGAPPTTTSLVSSLNPARAKFAVTYTATVKSQSGGGVTGTVTFQDGNSTVATVPLAGNQSSYSTSYKTTGTHLMVASYSGDLQNTGSRSPLLTESIFNGYASTTTLTSSLNPSTYGQKVTWTAMVTSSGSIAPTGTVKFTWSGHTIGSATLSSGVATLSRSNLITGNYPLTAVYLGDANNLGSTSAIVNQVVLETTSKARLTSSPNPSTQGQAVTFTATITSPTVIPTGPVTFTAGTTVLDTAQLAGGKAKLVISSLPVGSTKVTVKYNGNSNIAKSSASVIQTVQ